MISAILSRLVILVLGTLYPAYASYKAVKTKNVKEYVKWMMYWIVFALFTCAETLADTFVSWLPFYYELKIVFVLWLLSPATNGSSILYRKFVHPQLSKREKEIDNAIAKASEQGYASLVTLGTKGFNLAASAIVSTAAKGQAKLMDHVKKSYSVGDLSNENATDFVDGSRQRRFETIDDDTDDELDNRLIQERYNREMAEKNEHLQRPTSREVLHPVEEVDELPSNYMPRRRTAQTKKSTHTDPAHYATLPRTRKSAGRSALHRVD